MSCDVVIIRNTCRGVTSQIYSLWPSFLYEPIWLRPGQKMKKTRVAKHHFGHQLYNIITAHPISLPRPKGQCIHIHI